MGPIKALSKVTRFGPSPVSCSYFPKGFLASGVHCGIKKKQGLGGARPPLDLGLIVSTARETSAAGCFTRNLFKAAPVTYSMDNLIRNKGLGIRGVVVNSGCANAVTGKQGVSDASQMGRKLDQLLGLDHASSSLVLSTGIIGQLLPIDRVKEGIDQAFGKLSDSFEGWQAAAEAFMTTDTFPKLITHSFKLRQQEIRLVGIDKGAGMIHPSMGPPHATLLGLIATDADVHPDSLQIALTRAVDKSFNRITVDGDMSTNDTVLCLANGAAGNETLIHDTHSADFALFEDQLTQFALRLAQLIVRDAEGATKFVEVKVIGAENEEDAIKVAETIATSTLVKCALNGEDANWGRILCAVGYSQVKSINPKKVSVKFVSETEPPLELMVKGEPEKVDEARASEILREEDLKILVDLGNDGGPEASYFTSDLSKEYVAINGDYRS